MKKNHRYLVNTPMNVDYVRHNIESNNHDWFPVYLRSMNDSKVGQCVLYFSNENRVSQQNSFVSQNFLWVPYPPSHHFQIFWPPPNYTIWQVLKKGVWLSDYSIVGVKKLFVAQFTKFRKSNYSPVHPCMVLVKEHFFVGQMRALFLQIVDKLVQ